MFSKVSVLIPTRQRVARLTTMLASYDATTRGRSSSELVFRVDDDDYETQMFLAGYPYTVLVGPRLKGYESLSSFFNEMVAASTGDVLMLGNDDMVFKTYDWPLMLLNVANQHPDGLFDLGFSTLNETHYPFSTVSRRVVDALGFFWDPRIFWGDIFWRDVMAYFGRCIMIPEVCIEHDWAGFNPDKTFTDADKDIVQRDQTYWSVTHASCVREAVEKLMGLAVRS